MEERGKICKLATFARTWGYVDQAEIRNAHRVRCPRRYLLDTLKHQKYYQNRKRTPYQKKDFVDTLYI